MQKCLHVRPVQAPVPVGRAYVLQSRTKGFDFNNLRMDTSGSMQYTGDLVECKRLESVICSTFLVDEVLANMSSTKL